MPVGSKYGERQTRSAAQRGLPRCDVSGALLLLFLAYQLLTYSTCDSIHFLASGIYTAHAVQPYNAHVITRHSKETDKLGTIHESTAQQKILCGLKPLYKIRCSVPGTTLSAAVHTYSSTVGLLGQ